jgi:protease I
MNTELIKNKSVLLILPAKDFNTQEYLITKQTIEKAGLKVFIASDAFALCSGTDGLKVRADVSLFNMNEENFGSIVFIGGRGVTKYWDNSQLYNIAAKFNKSRKIIGAICGAPVILARAGLLSGKQATCFPDNKKELEREGVIYNDLPVVQDKNFITARDSSSALEFAEKIAHHILK